MCMFVCKELIELQSDQRAHVDLGLSLFPHSLPLWTGGTASLQPALD